MASPMTSSHLPLSDLYKGQIQGHSRVEDLCLLKEQS